MLLLFLYTCSGKESKEWSPTPVLSYISCLLIRNSLPVWHWAIEIPDSKTSQGHRTSFVVSGLQGLQFWFPGAFKFKPLLFISGLRLRSNCRWGLTSRKKEKKQNWKLILFPSKSLYRKHKLSKLWKEQASHSQPTYYACL